jgi:ABC-2 type transport system permease protein
MIRWLRQYWALCKNAFVVCLSDPVYLVLLLTVLGLMALLACLPTYNFGEELRLVRDQSLALTFLGGCVVGAVGVTTAIVRDMRLGTVAILMSRPVSSFSFVLGKWSGVAGAVILYQLTATAACLWATRLIGEGGEEQHIDQLALAVYAGVILLALGLMALKHYFFGGWYVWQASLAVCGCFVLGFLVVNAFSEGGTLQAYGAHVDWKTAAACLLLLLAELIFCALLVPIAVRSDMVTTLVGGCIVFFLGLMSEYVLTNALPAGWVTTVGKAFVPNWQVFWIADFLAGDHAHIAASYLGVCLVHTVLYSLVCLVVATLLFNRREFAGHESI